MAPKNWQIKVIDNYWDQHFKEKRKHDADQLYAICDHLNAANNIANALGIDYQLQNQLSDITDTIAALAQTHDIKNNPYFSEELK